MFNKVKIVRELCKERNIAISTLEKECGFANGYLNPKKINKLPYDRAVVIAKYLGVSADLILNGEETKKAPALNERDRRDIAKYLEQMLSDLESNGDLMFDGDPMSDEARESIRQALQMGLEIAKVKNKERFTPKKYREG